MTMKGSGWKGWQAVVNSLALVLLGVFLVSTTFAAERVEYYHTDALGSVVAATDASGAVLWREAYQPFGKRIDNEISSKDNTPFYTGKPHDVGTGLSYFGARYYDPSVGRFLGKDPVEVDPNNLHSFNRYAYANNNPYTFVDPDGKLPIIPIAYWVGKELLASVVESYTGLPVTYKGAAKFAAKNFAKSGLKGATKRASGTHRQLNNAGATDSHHIIQNAAAKNLPGYNRMDAPAVQLQGPSTAKGSEHYIATQVQRQRGGGTYAAERRIGYKAMRKAGLSQSESRSYIQRADDYFMGKLGVSPNTSTRPVGNRR